ncbi:MAG: DOMON domain-containing protein [bacterium]|nr:DOMON domain-containing protein [bacterium]
MKISKYLLILAVYFTWGWTAGNSNKWVSDGVLEGKEYSYTINLVQDKLVLHYRFDSDYIYFGIEAKSSGWSAIGFEPDKGVRNADIILIFIEDDSLKVLDSYSTGIYCPHRSDKELGGQDDILDFGGRIDSIGYVVEFKRILESKDKFDKSLVKGKEFTLIYAMAKSHNIRKKHDLCRGFVKIKLVV